MDKNFKGITTTAIHGHSAKDAFNAHLNPIYATTTFTYNDAEHGIKLFNGDEKGYIYSRWGNPTVFEAEETLAALETFGLRDSQNKNLKARALLHSSGMGALTTLVMANLKAGDTILTHFSLYGGMQELLEKILPPLGIHTIIEDLTKIENAEKILAQNKSVKLLYLETPANPTLQIVDLENLIALAKSHQIITAVDNTFATSYLQQPFKFGADFVFHSTTKFLNGHGNALGGVLIGTDLELMNGKISKWYKLLGATPSAFDAFLLSNGLKTLELRMQRHCENAQKLAEFLHAHPKVAHVNYLGLIENKGYELCKKQMKHAGAMMSFELKGGFEAGKNFINKIKICTRTVSLGTTDTLVSHPASSTHFGIDKQKRLTYGITDGLIRMSVGLENIEDLIEDINQAIE